jgi:dethiobiotin synthetase
MKGLFLTGTDTAVGKTFITAGIARCLRRQGRAVRVAKPVATGAAWVEGRWRSEDTWQLAIAAGQETELAAITPWVFAEPVAPAVAARLQGRQLELRQMADAVRRVDAPEGVLLVEGVGGLLCPLTERETVADLVAELELPLVIVARNTLGVLNHTLLTLDAARQRGLAVAGVVVNTTDADWNQARATNADELTRWIAVPLLCEVPYQPGPATAEPAALAAVDWWRLCGRG